MMIPRSFAFATLAVVVLTTAPVIGVRAAEPFSKADKIFVAKVSQGGMYEVELAKVAETKATTQDLKDQANTESHDHQLVGNKLKGILEKNGMPFPTALNADFQDRLDKISALPAEKFDAAYIAAMKEIHDADGMAFAEESKEGTNADLKEFAAETYRIVQRHLGELNAKVK